MLAATLRDILAPGPELPWPDSAWGAVVGWTQRQMAAAVGASLLIAAALTVALLSSLATVGIGLGPFTSATPVPAGITLEAPAANPVGANATPEIDRSDTPALLPQEQRCPCP